jgi:hypothetical protein
MENFSFTKLFMDFPPSASNNAMVPHVPWVPHMLSSVVTSISLVKKLKRATNNGHETSVKMQLVFLLQYFEH